MGKGLGGAVIAAALLVLLCGGSFPARAAFPERPVTLLVGFAPGGSMDLSARALAGAAERLLRQPVVIENRTGGTGTVALASLLAQAPDGHTLCATPSSVLIRVPQLQRVPFRPLRDFRPLIGFAAPPLGIVVRSDAPWKDLRALVAEAASRPGSLQYATTGVGSTTHAAVDAIALRERLQLIHIPYKGGMEALTALLGGHVAFAALTSEFLPAVRAGQARLLATMGERRSPRFPAVPTLQEGGYDFVNDAVFTVVRPSRMPASVAARLEAAFAEALKDEACQETLKRIDMVPVHYDARACDAFLRGHWQRIQRHLLAAGLIKGSATPPE